MSTTGRLLRLLQPYRWWIALAVLLAFATVGANVGLMAVAAYLISRAALVNQIADLAIALAAVRMFAIGRAAVRYVERYVTHITTFRILTRLRVWFYDAVEPLAPAHLGGFHSGDLLARIMADIETLENFYVRVVVPPLAAALVTGLAVWILGRFDWFIALTLLLFLLLTGVALPLVTRLLSRAAATETVGLRSELHSGLVDQVQGAADLLAYGRAEGYLSAGAAVTAQLHRQQERLALWRGLSQGLGALFTGLAALTALWLAIPLVSGANLAGVYLALLPLTAIAAFEAVQPLSTALQFLESSQAAGERLFGLIDAPPPVLDPANPLRPSGQYSLEVRDLRFRYGPTEPWVLDGLSFTVPAGGRVALTSPSGTGKTTLVNLLLRFWEYGQGEIRIGGVEIREMAAEDVRALIGVVEQNTHLFNTTVRDNLLLARPDATDAEIVAACERAQLHMFIAGLPHGYDTLVGENGVLLSGGERQRLALARAMLKDAPLLVLDEATSHLDPVTELGVIQALDTFMQGRTTLFIAHHSSGLARCDEIIHLGDGAAQALPLPAR